MTALELLEQKKRELLNKKDRLENDVENYTEELKSSQLDLSLVETFLEDIEEAIKLLTPN